MDAEPMARDETVVLDGRRFHYRDWGDPAAPPVVLLHAYLQGARTWATVARGLADRVPVDVTAQRSLRPPRPLRGRGPAVEPAASGFGIGPRLRRRRGRL